MKVRPSYLGVLGANSDVVLNHGVDVGVGMAAGMSVGSVPQPPGSHSDARVGVLEVFVR